MMRYLGIHAVPWYLLTFSLLSLSSESILLVIGLCVQLCTHVSGGHGCTWCLTPHVPSLPWLQIPWSLHLLTGLIRLRAHGPQPSSWDPRGFQVRLSAQCAKLRTSHIHP